MKFREEIFSQKKDKELCDFDEEKEVTKKITISGIAFDDNAKWDEEEIKNPFFVVNFKLTDEQFLKICLFGRKKNISFNRALMEIWNDAFNLFKQTEEIKEKYGKFS